MTKKPNKANANPYRVLYWMGAGVALLLLGVVALVVLMPKGSRSVPDPERTLLWLYPGNPDAVVIMEEARSQRRLVAVPFPAPEAAAAMFAGGKNPRRATDEVAAMLQRQIHHRVFLPVNVVETLIDAAGGIAIEGRPFSGASALAFIREPGEQGARRAAQVMLALADAASARGVSMSASQGLSLARQIDTDLDLIAITDVLARWSGYPDLAVEAPVAADPASLQALLLPDPPEDG